MLKKIFMLFGVILSGNAWADDCLQYKITPKIILNAPDWTKTVVQPEESMELWNHGNVEASFVEKSQIAADVKFIKTGFCVILKEMDVVLGYNDFLVKIDKSYKPETCAYNAVLNHENKHIQTYLSVIDDNKEDLHKTVFEAADSVMPIFVEKKSQVDAAIEQLNQAYQAYPGLVLLKQKIKAAEEIKNKKIDQDEDGAELMKCFE